MEVGIRVVITLLPIERIRDVVPLTVGDIREFSAWRGRNETYTE
jgi:hypothetical protein